MNHEEAIKEWDLTIEPQSSLFKLNLKDVWRYRDLLGLLVKRDITAGYKQTVLGPLWLFIQPLFTTLTYIFIFGNLAGLSTDGLPRPLFYMSSILLWTYFNDCLIGTSNVFRANAGIFGKVYFPRLIMPLTLVVSNLVKFFVQFIMFVLVLCYICFTTDYTYTFSLSLLLTPFLIILMAILSLGLGMIVSSVTTKYRDLSYLIGFGMSLFMYATPVVYPMSAVPDKYKSIVNYNPLSSIIEGFRYALLGNPNFTYGSLVYSTVFALVILFVGVITFTKVEKNFVDTV